MKKDRMLNPELLREIAALGHTEGICIADCGLPIPKNIKVIDLSVVAGLPHFIDVLRAVKSELVIESYVLASEISEYNPDLERSVGECLPDLPCKKVSHEQFKKMISDVKCVVRTGETLSYANIILVGGVNF